MSTANAIALLSPSASEPVRGSEGRGDGKDFDRHLDVAEAGSPSKTAPANTRPQPAGKPGTTRGEVTAENKPVTATLAPDAPPPDETDPTVAAELLAMTASAVVIVVPPPIADPLALAATPVLATAPDAAVTDAAALATTSSAIADLANDTRLASANADAAVTHARTAQAHAEAQSERAQGQDVIATAPADAQPTTSAAVVPAMAAATDDSETTDPTQAAVDPTSAAAATAAGTSAPPIATVRPAHSRIERETAPDVLAEGVTPKATPAVDTTSTVRNGDTVPALGPVSGERGQAKIEAPVVPPGESARAANAMDRAVAGQVSRAILTRGADGERMLVLRLTPPELGTVRIEIVERAGVVTARIHAEDDAVRSALERSLPQLRQDLRANDAPVRDVSLADAWNGFANRQGRNDTAGERERRQRDDDAPAFSIDGAAPVRATPRQTIGLGGLANANGVDARA